MPSISHQRDKEELEVISASKALITVVSDEG
jgi:hypothetical protein